MSKYYIGLNRIYQASIFFCNNGYCHNTETCDDIFRFLKIDKSAWGVPDFISSWINEGNAKILDNNQKDK